MHRAKTGSIQGKSSSGFYERRGNFLATQSDSLLRDLCGLRAMISPL